MRFDAALLSDEELMEINEKIYNELSARKKIDNKSMSKHYDPAKCKWVEENIKEPDMKSIGMLYFSGERVAAISKSVFFCERKVHYLLKKIKEQMPNENK